MTTTRERALEAALRDVQTAEDFIQSYDWPRALRALRQINTIATNALALPPTPQPAPAATGEHTPGPWHVCDPIPEQRENDGTSPYIHHEGRVIAVMNDAGQDDVQARIDARLIAAAPDMLAALQGIIEAESDGFDLPNDRRGAAVRAATARATGREG